MDVVIKAPSSQGYPHLRHTLTAETTPETKPFFLVTMDFRASYTWVFSLRLKRVFSFRNVCLSPRLTTSESTRRRRRTRQNPGALLLYIYLRSVPADSVQMTLVVLICFCKPPQSHRMQISATQTDCCSH